MATEITSKHLRTSVELTVVADIRPGFVQTTELMSYATRLGLLLETFFEIRKASIERRPSGYVGPLERLRTLHFVRWSILEGGRKLLLAVTFDRPWEPYIRSIVDQAGPFLDVILCHCTDFDGHSSDKGYRAFADWVRKHQSEVPFFHAAEPDLTVDDLRYLREFERRHAEHAAAAAVAKSAESSKPPSFEAEIVKMAVGERGKDGIPPGPPTPTPEVFAGFLRQLGLAAGGLLRLRRYFPLPDEQRFFDMAAWQLFEGPLGAGDESGKQMDAILAAFPNEVRQGLELMKATAQKAALPKVVPLDVPDETHDIQGNILSAYQGMTHGKLALLSFDTTDAARAFLSNLLEKKLVTVEPSSSNTAEAINVALTFNGLGTLGFSERELAAFPKEFREGMQARAGLLGDVAEEHPERWEQLAINYPRGTDAGTLPLSSVDLLLIVQKRGSEPELQSVLGERPDEHGIRVHVQSLERQFWQPKQGENTPETGLVKEHFGFKDGISQPVPRLKPQDSGRDHVAVGELLLGYKNERGECYLPITGSSDPIQQRVDKFVKNGSFLVVRKLEQHVGALRRFVKDNATTLSDDKNETTEVKEERVYAKLMGRGRNGQPLVGQNPNDFEYSDDKEGVACPFVAHIRRANPRTKSDTSVHGLAMTTPRILRRGFSYGPPLPESSTVDDGQSRGIMFMAYNASIAEQFEIVQRWINGGNSTGILSSRGDPIASHRADHVSARSGSDRTGQPREQVVTILDDNGTAKCLKKPERFVTLKWGAYLFVPSLSALNQLASREDPEPAIAEENRAALAMAGERIIAGLGMLGRAEGELAAKTQWKIVLEDRGARDAARAVWAAIRQRGGVLRTPYGVLVGSADGVRRVLGNEDEFSVRTYWHRMRESVGPLYLGMDRCPMHMPEAKATRFDAEYESRVKDGTYDALAQEPNKFMAYRLKPDEAFLAARTAAEKVLEKIRLGSQPKTRPVVDVAAYAGAVVTLVSQKWFGVPDKEASYEKVFLIAAQNIFYPHPESTVGEAARAIGQRTILEAERRAFDSGAAMGKALEKVGWKPEDVGRALIGAGQGFLVPTAGSFISVINQWLESGRISRVRQWLIHGSDGKELLSGTDTTELDKSLVFEEMLEAMRRRPVPDILHRRAVQKSSYGGVDIEPGDTVVVGLGSAIADDPKDIDLLFGGPYVSAKTQRHSVHACPGQKAALGVICGMLVALLGQKDLAREGRLLVSVAPDDTPPEAQG